jgi:hypothetical protein
VPGTVHSAGTAKCSVSCLVTVTGTSNSSGSQAPHAHTTRSAASTSPPTRTALRYGASSPGTGTARPLTRCTPAASASLAVTWVARRALITPAFGSQSRKLRSSPRNSGKNRAPSAGSSTSHGISRFFRTWALSFSQPSGVPANHIMPASW